LLAGRIRPGQPLRLVLKLMIAATASALAVVSVGWQPASLAVGTGAATWPAGGVTDLAAGDVRVMAELLRSGRGR
jgi:hypothetical protein